VAVIFADPSTGDLDSVITDPKLVRVIHALLWSHHHHTKEKSVKDETANGLPGRHAPAAESVEVKLEADPLLVDVSSDKAANGNEEDDIDDGDHNGNDDIFELDGDQVILTLVQSHVF
jgi:hypothetical protein